MESNKGFFRGSIIFFASRTLGGINDPIFDEQHIFFKMGWWKTTHWKSEVLIRYSNQK